jgi:acetolactate synthase I/II/III large subunit
MCRTVAAAYHIATEGRPGPVLIDVTKDAQQGSAPFVWPARSTSGIQACAEGSRQAGQAAAAQMIAEAERPIFYLGGGTIRAKAPERITQNSSRPLAPRSSRRSRLAVYSRQPPAKPRHARHARNGPRCARTARSDLLIVLGARFDDRVTGKVSEFAPDAKVIHVDIDPAEIGKIREADVPIVGDVREVIIDLIPEWEAVKKSRKPIDAWWKRLEQARADFPLGFDDLDDGCSRRRESSRRLVRFLAPRPSMPLASGNTKCGQHSSLNTSAPARGSTRVEPEPWASRSRRDGSQGRAARSNGVGHRR